MSIVQIFELVGMESFCFLCCLEYSAEDRRLKTYMEHLSDEADRDSKNSFIDMQHQASQAVGS